MKYIKFDFIDEGEQLQFNITFNENGLINSCCVTGNENGLRFKFYKDLLNRNRIRNIKNIKEITNNCDSVIFKIMINQVCEQVK